MKNVNNDKFSLKSILIIVLITSIISGFSGGFIVYSSHNKKSNNAVNNIYNDKYLSKFVNVYSQINNEFYEDIDKEELTDHLIDEMLKYLDDNYTSFLTEEETNLLNNSIMGEYQGIGIMILNNTVVRVFDDSPAFKAGIKPGDVLVKINDEDVSEIEYSNISKKISSSKDGLAKLIINRDGKELDFEIKLEQLEVPVVESMIIEDENIGYISLSSFTSTASKQIEDAINDFNKNNIESVILDLRGNTGGLLSASKDIASIFLKKGKTIFYLENSSKKEKIVDEDNKSTNFKLVVLIDETSASSSEILAAALKESYGAKLVGKTSYGKGKVQQAFTFTDGKTVKYTSAKWLTPSGNCIDKIGLVPDYDVDLTFNKDNKDNIKIEDSQYNKAVEILKNGEV